MGFKTEKNKTFLRIYGFEGEPGGRGGWRRGSTNQITAGIGFEEFALLGEFAEVALPDILDRRHIHLLVCAHEDERCEVRRVHVRVREATAEREDFLDVALVRQVARRLPEHSEASLSRRSLPSTFSFKIPLFTAGFTRQTSYNGLGNYSGHQGGLNPLR